MAHDALDLTVQVSLDTSNETWDPPPPALAPAPDMRPGDPQPQSPSDIWWPSLETSSNLFIRSYCTGPLGVTSGWYASYWNAFFFSVMQSRLKCNMSLEVHDVFPKYGSQEGGTLLTLSGAGFSSDCAENVVTVGGVACEIESCTGVTIVCETSSHSTLHKISNSGKHPGTVKLKTLNWKGGVSKDSK